MSEKYELIVRATERALLELIASARGTCRTFRPKTLVKRAGLSTKPITLTLVNYYLRELTENFRKNIESES